MYQIKAKLVYNKEIKKGFFHCSLEARKIAAAVYPGQFVNIKLSHNFEPLLRRPFSIYRVGDSRVEILYAVVGPGTEIFSQKKSGDYLDIIGPLGNGFKLKGQAVLVAGGMGVAPLVFLAERLAYRENKTFKLSAKRYPLNAIALIGAKTKSQILCEKEFKNLGCEIKISTDDGSRGFKGKVTDLLKHLLPNVDYRLSTIYACGPRPMLQEISRLSKKYSIPAQISLEEHMACGIGACLGCAVNTKDGFKRVCKEGPVLDAHEIIWE